MAMSRALRPYEIYPIKLFCLNLGYALFEPNPNGLYDKVRVGDVGYIQEGKFIKLFNAFHPADHSVNQGLVLPNGFTAVPPEYQLIDNYEDLAPGLRRSESVRRIGGDMQVSGTVTQFVGTNLRLSCSTRRGASLLTKYRAPRQYSLSSAGLAKYMLDNYSSWLELARSRGGSIQMHDLIFVKYCVLTGDWANITWDKATCDAEVGFAVGMPGTANVSATLWGQWEDHINVPARQGPHRQRRIRRGSEPDVLDQCIFLKGFRVARREWYNRLAYQIKIFLEERGSELPANDSGVTPLRFFGDPQCRIEIVGGEGSSSFHPVRDIYDLLAIFIFEKSESTIAIIDEDVISRLQMDDIDSLVDFRDLLLNSQGLVVEILPELSQGTEYTVGRIQWADMCSSVTDDSEIDDDLLLLDEQFNRLERTSEESPEERGKETGSVDEKAIVVHDKLYDELDLTGRVTNVGQCPVRADLFWDIWEGRLCRRNTGYQKVAVRIFRRSDQTTEDSLINERLVSAVRAWSKLHHQNLLVPLGFLYGIAATNTSLASLVLPWTPNRAATQYLKERSDSERRRVLTGIVDGLCYLHMHYIVHGDVKGRNIFIDEHLNPRLADFGLVKLLSAEDGTVGTHRWMAPELISGDPSRVTRESDVWALGMTIVELFTSLPPFHYLKSDVHVFLSICAGVIPDRPNPSTGIDDYLWSLCKDCWNMDPLVRRPSTLDLAQRLLLHSPRRSRDKDSSNQSLSSTNVLTIHEVTPSMSTDVRRAEQASVLRPDIPDISNLLVDVRFDYSGDIGSVRRGKLDYTSLEDRATDVIEVAIKRFKIRHIVSEHTLLKKIFFDEMQTWKRQSHKNILEFLGITDNLPLSLISPWMENGNVNTYLDKHPEVLRLPLLEGTISGIEYLHSEGIVHGNIKGNNILISNEGDPLLCDFGLARFGCRIWPNSLPWMAAELFDFNQSFVLTKASDMWAFGMVAIELLTGTTPFPDMTSLKVIMAVQERRLPPRPTSEECSDALWELVQQCWMANPDDRPKATEARAVLASLCH